MSDTNITEVTINGVTYVRKDTITNAPAVVDGLEYAVVRTYSAGVFAGYVEKEDGEEVTLRNARRIWFWAGAATLSELANEGTSKPKECKFPAAVPTVRLKNAIEVIPASEKARKSIESVAVWSAK